MWYKQINIYLKGIMMAGTEMNFWLPSCSIGPSGYWSVLGRLGPGPTWGELALL